MTIRPVALLALLVVVVLAEVRFLSVASPSGVFVLGLLVAMLASGLVSLAAWAGAGGAVVGLCIGAGRPVWFRRSASGFYVQVNAVPLAISPLSFGARLGRSPRAPFVALLACWAALGVVSLGVLATTRSEFAFGVAAGTLVVGVVAWSSRRPSAALPAARSEREARARARLTPVFLASARSDYAAVLELTADAPPVPRDWTDAMLTIQRAAALSELSRPTEAVRLLRIAVDGAGALRAGADGPRALGGLAPLLPGALATALFFALLRGEVPAEHVASVVAEIRNSARLRPPSPLMRLILDAQAAYVDGHYPRAITAAVRAARHSPPGERANAYALAALSCARSGDADGSRHYLDLAVRDNPDAPLLLPASAGVNG
ncbi:hypothetical protein [Cryptosporangium phraense]|uniref:Tetratricopeptide repeat protein n=1 Tax=Cryptosporangium phraense TaxID=2593070 RepID=A0A545AP35_9ACTN|nr:hypothetical protein [Cryptosporangium phraense]TQS43077.1 hypothetical protein FL583_21835 [Cryptosporangium phraense]